MANRFLEIGRPIKMEVDVIPTYVSLQGVIEELDKDVIVVKLDLEYLQKDPQKVRCTITDHARTLVCLFKTIIKETRGNRLVLVRPQDREVQITQRRKYLRVPIDKEVKCYLIGIGGRQVESDKVFPAKIKDISGGGALLNSPLSLPVGTVLVFEIQLDDLALLLTIEVLRLMENPEDGTNNIGCQFIGISNSDRQKIIAYCNKQQLILRRKGQI